MSVARRGAARRGRAWQGKARQGANNMKSRTVTHEMIELEAEGPFKPPDPLNGEDDDEVLSSLPSGYVKPYTPPPLSSNESPLNKLPTCEYQ